MNKTHQALTFISGGDSSRVVDTQWYLLFLELFATKLIKTIPETNLANFYNSENQLETAKLI